ncbi:MAG: DUF4124 domain-containing protein [Arenimonas sp.]|uniref:DUF4124 domain-containing protein n=1 Tax=Arenimonas sp. TaxID=1872635 RepID=UPI0025C1016E|nr:DUF4124 domain-containing protein [Arenimonas sp.]MBW8367943.1 DUF4124 domain-containing protein [Arenimonas sp.]
MIRKFLSLAVIAAVLSASASAQEKEAAKKLYRWTDKDGKVQFSDTLPPEAVDQARTEINADSGMTTSRLDRALTEEERAAQEALALAAETASKHAERIKMTEEAMIASFQSEEELKRSFKIRTELLQQTLDAIEAGIGSQRASLASQLADASEAELAGRRINARQASSILALHVEMAKQQEILVIKQGELVALDQDLVRLVERFSDIKGAGKAPAPTPPPPAG